MKIILSLVIAIIILAAMSFGYSLYNQSRNGNDNTNTVVETERPSKDDLISVSNIMPEQRLSSPFTVEGEARGNWYFEATFPIEIINEKGETIGQSYAQAQGEWMTEEYVPYEGTIEFDPGESTKGEFILKNSNASGLPENDKELRIPITF